MRKRLKKTPRKSNTKAKKSESSDEEEAEKTPQKSTTKAKKVETSDEEEDDEELDDDKKPLLDQPLEVTGARERKRVERLDLSFKVGDKKLDIVEGSGQKLGECPRIEYKINKVKGEELKTLHRVLFGRVGAALTAKKNIRQFSGFTFSKNSTEFEKKRAIVEKVKMIDIKKMCELLDLERSGGKEEIIQRLLEFLLSPSDSGKKVPSSKKRSSSGKGGKAKANKGSKKAKKSKSSDATDESSQEEENGDDEDGEDHEEEDDEQEESEAESEKEEKKKSKKTPKKPAKSKTPAKKPAKSSEKKTKQTKRKRPSSDDESSDDEPLVKKSNKPPTNDEIKTLIKKILDGANLEEITMKTVCKQVYAAYPDFDLGDRKDFIKSSVRALIS